MDVGKAFLQGMIYEEIQEQGEPAREVNFALPPGSAAILRQVSGYGAFDENAERPRCIMPGTGCKGAPRASCMKLTRVTRSLECSAKPARRDPELEVKREVTADHVGSASKLVLMLSRHVDDLKFAGQKQRVDWPIAHVEIAFG